MGDLEIQRFRRELLAHDEDPWATALGILGIEVGGVAPAGTNVSQPNALGTVRLARHVRARRGGRSSLGRAYGKGDPILELTSTRRTSNKWTLLPSEVLGLLAAIPASWRRMADEWAAAGVPHGGQVVARDVAPASGREGRPGP